MPVAVDNHTPRLDLPLPDESNFLQDDVKRIQESLTKLGNAVATIGTDGKLDQTQLPDNAAKVDAKGILLESQLPASVVVVDKATNKLPAFRLPVEGITNVRDANNEAGMLALPATPGDVCRRLDNNQFFILAALPPATRTNWREIPATAVSSINGRSGAVTGIALSGVNNDITDLTGLTAQLHLPQDGVDQNAAVTRRQLDKAGGGYVSQLIWHHNRSSLPDGYLIGDGQEVDRTLAPSLFAEVQAGRVPVCTEAEWWANLGKRGCYTLGATDGKFRVPDYNGTQAGSIAAPFLRGSLPSDAQYKGWIQQNAAPNLTGIMNLRPWYVAAPDAPAAPTSSTAYNLRLDSNGVFTGQSSPVAFPSSAVQGPVGIVQKLAKAVVEPIGFDASKSNPVYGRKDLISGLVSGEVRPNAIVGCYIIRFAGRALEAGFVDPVTVSTKLQELYDDVKKLNNTVGYELLDFGTMGLSARKVLSNPFGNTTPVICVAEVFHATLKKWVASNWIYADGGTTALTNAYGTSAWYAESEGIVVRTGNFALIGATAPTGASQDVTATYNTPSPVRVHVWNIGNDTTQLELQRVAVSKLSDLWLPYNDPRVLEYIEWDPTVMSSSSGYTQGPEELLVNIKPNAIHIKGIVRRPFALGVPIPVVGGSVTQAQQDAALNTLIAARRICRFKKMLPGYTRIPRAYVHGIIDVTIFGITNLKTTAAPTKVVPTALGDIRQSEYGFVNIFAGINDANPATAPRQAELQKDILLLTNQAQTATWFMFDGVIPFA